MRRRQTSPATIAGALAIFGLLAFGSAPACARIGHQFGFAFAGSGTDALSAPTGIAVDNSSGPSAGSIYVTDPTNRRVEKFDAAGNFVLMFGKNVNATTLGNICPVNPGDVCQSGTSGGGPGEFNNPRFVAVDNSSGPSAGDVYVAQGGTVQKFDAGGHLVTGWGNLLTPGLLSKSSLTNHTLSNVNGIAVDPSGNLWVPGTEGVSRLFEFDQAGSPVEDHVVSGNFSSGGLAIDPSGPTFYVFKEGGYLKFASGNVEFGRLTFGTEGVAVSPTSGDLFTSSTTSIKNYHFLGGQEVLSPSGPCYFGFHVKEGTYEVVSDKCAPTESFGSGATLTGARGLAVSAATDSVYAADTSGHTVDVFTPFILPDFKPVPPTNLTRTSATVNEEVDPAGGPDITGCTFEYGMEVGNYSLGSGSCTPDPGANPPVSNFSTPTTVSADLSGLDVLVPYHYRFVVTTANGTTNGPDRVVRTVPDLPKVNATFVSAITPNSAVVKADIDPGEGLTTYRFDYGPTTGYESHTLAGGPIAPNDPDHIAAAELADLEPGIIYHFRVAATNYSGTTFGPDQVFTTPSTPLVDSPTASSIGPTSANLNALVNPGFSLTSYHFEYGTSSDYGAGTPEGAPIGPDSIAHAVRASVVGLTAGATYHFRVVAANAIGTTYGADQTFRTSDLPQESPTPAPKPCRKGLVKRHGKCVKRKKKRNHGRSAKNG